MTRTLFGRGSYKPRPRRTIPPLMRAEFLCPKYHTKLSRHSCGQMHRKANGSCRPGTDAVVASEIARCRRCEIGAVHAKGKQYGDVELVQITPRGSSEPAKRRLMAWQDPMPLPDRRRRKGRGGW